MDSRRRGERVNVVSTSPRPDLREECVPVWTDGLVGARTPRAGSRGRTETLRPGVVSDTPRQRKFYVVVSVYYPTLSVSVPHGHLPSGPECPGEDTWRRRVIGTDGGVEVSTPDAGERSNPRRVRRVGAGTGGVGGCWSDATSWVEVHTSKPSVSRLNFRNIFRCPTESVGRRRPTDVRFSGPRAPIHHQPTLLYVRSVPPRFFLGPPGCRRSDSN